MDNDGVTTSKPTGAGRAEGTEPDPVRSMELLWRTREPPKRGPKPRLTVDRIAECALELADREGLGAVSMRRVAEQLGVTAMSLYTYVPSKAELVEVILDMVYGETARPEHTGGWRACLERIAIENWTLYQRHSWLLQVPGSRPTLGPNLIAKYDYELRALEGIGLSDVEMDQVLSLISNFVHGAVRGALDAERTAMRSGMTDEQWWEVHGPLLQKVLDPDRYPTAARVGTTSSIEYNAASDPRLAFQFGLTRVLDGIAVLVERRD